MKRILLILLIFTLFSGIAQAANTWNFPDDDANQWVQLADDAALTVPSGNFSYAGWLLFTRQVGTSAQWVMEWDDGGTAFFHIIAYEASHATNANKVGFLWRDSDGDYTLVWTVSTPVTTKDTWFHFVVTVDGTGSSSNATVYVNGIEDANQVFGEAFDGVNVANFMLWGERAGGAPDRFDGKTADWGFWTRVLAQDEITALASGCIVSDYSTGLKWYHPMADYSNEVIANIAVTEGANAATTAGDPGVASCAVANMAILVPLDKSGGKSNFKNGGKQ